MRTEDPWSLAEMFGIAVSLFRNAVSGRFGPSVPFCAVLVFASTARTEVVIVQHDSYVER